MFLTLFWGAVTLLLYTYVLFPILVYLRGQLRNNPFQRGDITPAVSVIIAAHNEEQNIRAKLENMLSLDYPSERLEVLIASDGSNDDTEDIVRSYAGRNVRLLSLPRVGKAGALNAAVAASQGDVLVFSDANSMYAPCAIRQLVMPLADPEVGGVAGDQRYLKDQNTAVTGDGERSYWDFDRKLKQWQSLAGSVTSATGAIYAIRRTLFAPVPDGVTDDFVTSTQVVARGYRLVFAPDGAAYEPVAESGGTEFGRKVRVVTRGLRGVFLMRRLLNPFRYGFYSVQLVTHKILRRLMVFPLLLLLLASILLWQHGPLYQMAALAQLGFYGLAAAGVILVRTRIGRVKIFTLPFFFCMVNLACLFATFNVICGHRIDRWEPQRSNRAGRRESTGVIGDAVAQLGQ